MASNNHSYRIEINANKSASTNYMKHFCFHPTEINGKTKKQQAKSWTIDLWIKRNKVYIQTNHEPTLHTAEKIMEGNAKYLCTTLKKAKIIHLILFNEPLEIKHIHITGKEFSAKGAFKKVMFDATLSYTDRGFFDPVFSMVEGKLIQTFSEEWKKRETILKLLEYPFIESSSCWTALNAFLCARNKHFEAERLLYNWMAFNAMYGYLDDIMFAQEKALGLTGESKTNEGRAISRIISLEDSDKFINGTREKFAKICGHIRSDLLGAFDIIDIEDIIDDIKNPSELSKQIEDSYANLENNYTAYDFMLTRFPYWLRCNLFHGGKPMPIMSFRSSSILNSLKLSNRLLDQYIEEHLLDYFDEDFLPDKTLEIAKKNVVKQQALKKEYIEKQRLAKQKKKEKKKAQKEKNRNL